MHLKGWGVKHDRQRAFYYFNLAAAANHALAQYNAAMIQLGSDPSAASCEKALVLLKRVAERGPVAEVLQVRLPSPLGNKFRNNIVIDVRIITDTDIKM
jgi:TPR repeat protein